MHHYPQVTLIDFPQMVSVSHENAQEMFDRDVECIIKWGALGPFTVNAACHVCYASVG